MAKPKLFDVPEPDPKTASRWLMNALKTARSRDIVDATADAEWLLALLQQDWANTVVEG